MAKGRTNEKNAGKKAANKSSAKKTRWGVRILIVLIVGACLGVSLLFEDKINYTLGLKSINETVYGGPTSDSLTTVRSINDLNVHFVDVGQGDACIVELPDDKNIIIDGGDDDAKDKLLSYISENIKRDDGSAIEYFDYAILTHSDRDHCGSMDEVLTKYPAKAFYRPNVLATRSGYVDPGAKLLSSDFASKDTIAYMNVIKAGHAGAEQVYVNSYELDPIVPDGLSEGDYGYYSLSFYGPNNTVYKDWNNYSPVIILEYAGQKIALSGDCEKEGEAEFVNKATAGEGKFARFDSAYAVNAIKLGHHGSSTSSSEAYLDVLTTEASVKNTLVIISCGFDNKYKHPHDSTLKRLSEMGFKDENILRTDQNGDIVLSVRFDEESDEMRLFYGASPVQKTQEEVVDWRYIALSIFVAVALVVLIQPFMKKAKRDAKKATGRRK